MTARAGITRSGWGQGCCVGDYDNDGFDDLFVSYFGRNGLYHNNGDGTFTDVSEKAGIAGQVFSCIPDVNVRMISQGASEINISFVIDDEDVQRTVERLHHKFFSELDPESFD